MMMFTIAAAAAISVATASGGVRYNPETHVAVKSSGCGSSSPYTVLECFENHAHNLKF